MNDDFRIVITISHNRISFEYYLKGAATVALQPITTDTNRRGVWPAPFSIYCSPTGIIIGEEAFHAAQRGTSNAFNDLFECMRKPDCFYEFCGERKHVSNLLLDACETVFRDFFSSILYNNYGILEQNRNTMPIVFVCEEDVTENERTIISNKFRNSGYGCVSVIGYQTFLEKNIRKDCSSYPNALAVWTEGKDLYLTLFDTSGQISSKSIRLDGLGVDPRLDYVVDQIWSSVVSWNGFLTKDKELDVIKDAANRFLSSTDSLVSDYVTLSDGQSYHYTLDRNLINYYQYSTREQLSVGVRDFLIKNEVQQNNTLLILRGVATNNNYFSTSLSSFRNIISDNDLRSHVMRLIVEMPVRVDETITTPSCTPTSSSTPTSSGSSTPIPSNNAIDKIQEVEKEWKGKRANVKGLIISKKYSEATLILDGMYKKAEDVNAEDVIREIKEYKKRIEELGTCRTQTTPPPSPPPVNLNREWRELKAVTNGQIRGGKVMEAKAALNEFLIKCKTTNNIGLIGEVEQQLRQLNDNVPPIPPKGKDRKPEQTVCEGEALLKKGRITEARDWYKNSGDSAKAKLLTDIIRLQRSVVTRKAELPNCQQTKDRQKINRIITEIGDYIDKCNQAGVTTEEYNKLLLEYKKIK